MDVNDPDYLSTRILTTVLGGYFGSRLMKNIREEKGYTYHIGADLITMCSMLRIPVCMHNVPEDKIFRPAAWNAFGMDKESADYRACQNFGPLFKKC